MSTDKPIPRGLHGHEPIVHDVKLTLDTGTQAEQFHCLGTPKLDSAWLVFLLPDDGARIFRSETVDSFTLTRVETLSKAMLLRLARDTLITVCQKKADGGPWGDEFMIQIDAVLRGLNRGIEAEVARDEQAPADPAASE